MPHLCSRLLLVSLLALALWSTHVTGAERPNSSGNETPTLQQTLEKGLKARRPQEFAFVARVVSLVNQRALPEKLVESTFLWARRQPRHPFQYFERAMQIRAARLGVDL